VPDWAVVLVAAFSGGLAGAVLQPLASHILERVRREEVIRRNREKSLRRMLTAAFDYGRALAAAGHLHYARQHRGATVSQAQMNELTQFPKNMPTWQPERIADPQLREVAEQHSLGLSKLMDLLLRPAPPVDEIVQLSERLLSLEKKAVRRMDELNWPEVDE